MSKTPVKGHRPEVKPKKALGQHFLTDEDVARRIASTLDVAPALPVLEVGPGMGVLTKYLISDGRDLKVAEIDTESIDYLQRNFPQLDSRILGTDFLKLDLDRVFHDAAEIAVIGNYPYNISSQIFFHVLDYKDRVTVCSGMLQKEVAERIAAPAGSKARGILSVLLQMWYDVEYLFTVGPEVFCPPPKVQSGVIRMTRNGVTDPGCDPQRFKTVVKTAFNQRRKTLRNSLRGLFPAGVPLPDDEMLNLRPEQLTVEQFVALTLMIYPKE